MSIIPSLLTKTYQGCPVQEESIFTGLYSSCLLSFKLWCRSFLPDGIRILQFMSVYADNGERTSADVYSSSRNTRDFSREIRAQDDTRLHREYNLAMKNKRLSCTMLHWSIVTHA